MQQELLNKTFSEKNHEEALSLNDGLMAKIHHSTDPHYCSSEPFRVSSYALILITKGKLNIKINFEDHVLNHRDILLVLPHSVYEITDNSSVSFISIHFNKSYLKNKGIFFNSGETYRMSKDVQSHKFSLSKEEYTFIYYDMLALHKKLNVSKDTPQIKNIVHNSFLELLYDIFLLKNKQKDTKPFVHNSRTELTNRFLALVSENFKKEKRVIYYANCLRITPRHLSQVVKQVTDRTAGEIIDEMVIREAKLLLTSHVMNISEVAIELCFSNSSFFGKYFKKQTGVTPSEYKMSNNIAV